MLHLQQLLPLQLLLLLLLLPMVMLRSLVPPVALMPLPMALRKMIFLQQMAKRKHSTTKTKKTKPSKPSKPAKQRPVLVDTTRFVDALAQEIFTKHFHERNVNVERKIALGALHHTSIPAIFRYRAISFKVNVLLEHIENMVRDALEVKVDSAQDRLYMKRLRRDVGWIKKYQEKEA